MKFRVWDEDGYEDNGRDVEALGAEMAAQLFAEQEHRDEPFEVMEVCVRDGDTIRTFTVDAEMEVEFYIHENPRRVQEPTRAEQQSEPTPEDSAEGNPNPARPHTGTGDRR